MAAGAIDRRHQEEASPWELLEILVMLQPSQNHGTNHSNETLFSKNQGGCYTHLGYREKQIEVITKDV